MLVIQQQYLRLQTIIADKGVLAMVIGFRHMKEALHTEDRFGEGKQVLQ